RAAVVSTMTKRVVVAGLMLVLAGVAVSRVPDVGPAGAETQLAQRGRAMPAPSGRGGVGREPTGSGDARTLVRAQVTGVDPALDGMKPGDEGLLKLGLVDVGPPA